MVNKAQGGGGAASPITAWVNFDGTGAVSIVDDLNVSSITDNGTGDYSVNFTTAYASANYAPSACCLLSSSTNSSIGPVETTYLRVYQRDNGTNSAVDKPVGIIVAGGV